MSYNFSTQCWKAVVTHFSSKRLLPFGFSQQNSRTVVTQQTINICTTFLQRRPNVSDAGPTSYKCLACAGLVHNPANMRRWHNVCLMLDQRLRRWSNINQHCANVSCLLGRVYGWAMLTCCNSGGTERGLGGRRRAPADG